MTRPGDPDFFDALDRLLESSDVVIKLLLDCAVAEVAAVDGLLRDLRLPRILIGR